MSVAAGGGSGDGDDDPPLGPGGPAPGADDGYDDGYGPALLVRYANASWAVRWSAVPTHPHWLRFGDAPRAVHYVMGALLLAVGVAGLLGNALVLVVFTRFRRLRGPFSAFIVNLAVADLSTSLLHGMVAASCFRGYWMFGATGCTLYAFGVGFFGLLSIVTLAAIAVERYLVITAKPMTASWKLSQYGARKVCVGVWLYCLCMCVPPLFGWSAYIPEGFLTSCSWDYLSRTPANRAFYVYLLTLGFVLPVAVIAYCYTFILAAVMAHSRDMRDVKHTGGRAPSIRSHGTAAVGLSGGGGGVGGVPVAAVAAATGTTPRSMIRTAEIIIMLVALFIVSWTPYAVVTLIAQFGDARLVTPWVATLPAFFAKASVVYNPIVYGLSHPHFRASLKTYMSSCRGGTTAPNTVSLAALRDAASTPARRAPMFTPPPTPPPIAAPASAPEPSTGRRTMAVRGRPVARRRAAGGVGGSPPVASSPPTTAFGGTGPRRLSPPSPHFLAPAPAACELTSSSSGARVCCLGLRRAPYKSVVSCHRAGNGPSREGQRM